MPNWCENYLEVCGSEDEVAKFMKENMNEDNELSFQMSVPNPNGEYNNLWSIENWGTKWEANETQLDDRGIHFETAWGPPSAWLEKVAEKYSSLQFTMRYAEGGQDFSGLIEYQNGECITEEDGECGEYFGYKYCHNCQEDTWWEYCDINWKDDFDMCTTCFGNACKTIRNAVRSKKIRQLPKKLACRRMGRNPIMDNYLMCKVFIPRLNECVV